MEHKGTIWFCARCGTERKRPVVPVELANELQREVEELRQYIKEAAGNETVLLPVATLNAIAERAENAERRLKNAVANAMQLDMLRRCHEDRTELKQRVRELEVELKRRGS